MFLLYDLQSPINIGQILRSGEQFNIPVIIYDPRNIFENPAYLATISDFSCGALQRKSPRFIADYAMFRAMHRGRIIATGLSEKAVLLPDFSFNTNDTVLLGNEYDGLPQHVIDECDGMMYIPLPEAVLYKPQSHSPIDAMRSRNVARNGIPNLNVAMTASIVSYKMYTQQALHA